MGNLIVVFVFWEGWGLSVCPRVAFQGKSDPAANRSTPAK